MRSCPGGPRSRALLASELLPSQFLPKKNPSLPQKPLADVGFLVDVSVVFWDASDRNPWKASLGTLGFPSKDAREAFEAQSENAAFPWSEEEREGPKGLD